MRNTTLEFRYCRALILAAQDADALDAVVADMTMLTTALREVKDLAALIAGDDEKRARAFVRDTLAQRCCPLMRRFLAVLSEKGRLGVLPHVPAAFFRLYDEITGNLTVDLTSATPLGRETEEVLGANMRSRTGKRCAIRASVDPDLLAGFIIMFGDRRIDCSVAGHLRRTKEYLRSLRIA
jgi:ATP synthase F1 delta subunit